MEGLDVLEVSWLVQDGQGTKDSQPCIRCSAEALHEHPDGADQSLCSTGHVTPGTGEANMPAQLSLPSEDILHSEGLTSASLDEEGAIEKAAGPAFPVRRLPSFALPERHVSSTSEPPTEVHAGPGTDQRWASTASGVNADPLGATGRVGRRSTDGSPHRPAAHGPADSEDVSHRVLGWSPSRSSAGASPARQLTAPSKSPLPGMSLDEVDAAGAAVQPMQDASLASPGAASGMHPDDTPIEAMSLLLAPGATASPDNSASAGIRALTREISELAYEDRDPYGSTLRRYRPTDAEEHHASAAVVARSDALALEEPLQSNDVDPTSEQDKGHEAEHSAATHSPEQAAVSGQGWQDMLDSLPDEVGD